MANRNNKNLITIPRGGGAGRRYCGFTIERIPKIIRKSGAYLFYLKGKEAKELDRLVERGLRDYKLGKTSKIKSLADLN